MERGATRLGAARRTGERAAVRARAGRERLGPGTRLLDVACGSGLLAALAAGRGAEVAGVDITPALLEIARERTPEGDFREADLAALPFGDAAFDAVSGVNAFQFALDPGAALREAARVLVPAAG